MRKLPLGIAIVSGRASINPNLSDPAFLKEFRNERKSKVAIGNSAPAVKIPRKRVKIPSCFRASPQCKNVYLHRDLKFRACNRKFRTAIENSAHAIRAARRVSQYSALPRKNPHCNAEFQTCS